VLARRLFIVQWEGLQERVLRSHRAKCRCCAVLQSSLFVVIKGSQDRSCQRTFNIQSAETDGFVTRGAREPTRVFKGTWAQGPGLRTQHEGHKRLLIGPTARQSPWQGTRVQAARGRCTTTATQAGASRLGLPCTNRHGMQLFPCWSQRPLNTAFQLLYQHDSCTTCAVRPSE
jgi:hypothetical protein